MEIVVRTPWEDQWKSEGVGRMLARSFRSLPMDCIFVNNK